MIDRVTSTTVNNSLVGYIQQNYADYSKLTEQLSTGKKINSIFDDPIQAINIFNSNRLINRIDIWSANIGSLTNEITQTSETIDLIHERAQRAKDLATTAANGTSTKSTLQATLTELDQIIESVVDLANTSYNGNYIFGGTNTKTPPYEIQYGIDADGNPTEEIIGIKYTGTPIDGEWQRQLEIADGVFETMNVTGAEAFGNCDVEPVFQADGTTPVLDAEGNPTYQVNESNGIMGELINLRNAISDTIEKYEEQENLPEGTPQADKDALANEISTCYDTINGLLDGFATAMDKMVQVNESFGADINKLEMSDESLADNKLNLKDYISGIQDLDLTEAISDWYSSQMAYQASMQASSSIMSMSLLNYM